MPPLVGYAGAAGHLGFAALVMFAIGLNLLGMFEIGGSMMGVGGKLAEYLAFDRPILAVMPRGEGRALVEGLPTGIVADVEPGSVADALERLLDHTPAPAPCDPAGRFDRVNLAGELARQLDRLVAERAERAERPG